MIKNKFINICLILFVFCFAIVKVEAQIFPCSSVLNTPPPHSPSLHTFTQPNGMMTSTNEIQLQLVLNDLTQSELQIGLHIEMVGENFSFSSAGSAYPAIFTLLPGQPLILTNQDLTPFFNPAVLEGLNLETFFSSDGFIPEGTYEICFTAYELSNNNQVSNTGCSVMFIEIYDPPELISPMGDILPQTPQDILAMWQPLHFGTFPVEYTYEIWESIEGLAMDQIIQSTFPVLSIKTDMTTAFLDINSIALQISQDYFARVTVSDVVNGPNGLQTYVFRNNGSSEIVPFYYGYQGNPEDEICEAPINCNYVVDQSNDKYIYWNDGIPPVTNFEPPATPSTTTATATAANNMALGGEGGGGGTTPPTTINNSLPATTQNSTVRGNELNSDTGGGNGGNTIEEPFFNSYRVYWRVSGENDWFISETTEEWILIEGLKNGFTYDVYVETVCKFSSVPGEPFIIEMPSLPPPREYYCGQPPLELVTDNMDGMTALAVGDTIIACDARVVITQVSGSNGTFTGEGYFAAPMLNSIRIAVTFNGVFVNDESFVVTGDVITKFDPTGSNIMDADAVAALFGNDQFDIPEQEIDGVIVSVTINENGQVVVIVEGQNDPLIFEQPVILTDSNGNGYQASGGYVMPIINLQNTDEFLEGYTFEFTAHPDQRYGFDAVKQQIVDEYELLDGRRIPYKSISIGGNDKVNGTFTFPNQEAKDSLKIVTEKGVVLPHIFTGENTVEVSLVGQGEGVSSVFAYIHPLGAAGKLNLWSDYLTNYNVHLVPVNNSVTADQLSGVADIVQNALKEGVMNLNITTLNNVEDTDPDGELGIANGAGQAFSDDLQRIINTFSATNAPSDIEFYIFLVNNLEGTYSGFMPKGINKGFVDVSTDNWERTIAHELCHGGFTLNHSWEDYSGFAQYTSQNLMDYAGAGSIGAGNELWYDQWKKMKNPDIELPWFQNEDGGANSQLGIEVACLPFQANQINILKRFKAPNNEDIKLDDVTDVPISFISKVDDGKPFILGSLQSFKRSGVLYRARFSGSTFTGYFNAENVNVFSEIKNSDGSVNIVEINKTSCEVKLNGTVQTGISSCDCDENNAELTHVHVSFETNHDNPLSYVNQGNWSDVNLHWNDIGSGKDYCIKVTGLANGNSSTKKYSEISSGKGTGQLEGIQSLSLKINENSDFDNLQIQKNDKFNFDIGVLESSSQECSTPLYTYTGESGKFYYNYKISTESVDQSICVNEEAGVGVAFKYNSINPCANTPEIPEVDPNAYDFSWTGDVSTPFQNCDTDPSALYYSKGGASPDSDSYYKLKRSAKLTNDLKLTAGSVTEVTKLKKMTDEAEIFVAIKEADECSGVLLLTYNEQNYENNNTINLLEEQQHEFKLLNYAGADNLEWTLVGTTENGQSITLSSPDKYNSVGPKKSTMKLILCSNGDQFDEFEYIDITISASGNNVFTSRVNPKYISIDDFTVYDKKYGQARYIKNDQVLWLVKNDKIKGVAKDNDKPSVFNNDNITWQMTIDNQIQGDVTNNQFSGSNVFEYDFDYSDWPLPGSTKEHKLKINNAFCNTSKTLQINTIHESKSSSAFTFGPTYGFISKFQWIEDKLTTFNILLEQWLNYIPGVNNPILKIKTTPFSPKLERYYKDDDVSPLYREVKKVIAAGSIGVEETNPFCFAPPPIKALNNLKWKGEKFIEACAYIKPSFSVGLDLYRIHYNLFGSSVEIVDIPLAPKFKATGQIKFEARAEIKKFKDYFNFLVAGDGTAKIEGAFVYEYGNWNGSIVLKPLTVGFVANIALKVPQAGWEWTLINYNETWEVSSAVTLLD